MFTPDLCAVTLFDDMFHLKLPVLEKILRPMLVYLALIVLLRIFGKRELAQLNPFDLVVLLSISNTVQNAIIGDDNSLTGGLIGATSLFSINYIVVRFLFKHRRLDQLLEGSPTVLVENGLIHRAALAKELLSESELVTVVHRQGFEGLDEIERCVLEPGGVFSIKGKKPGVDERQQAELLEKLDRISEQIADLRKRVN